MFNVVRASQIQKAEESTQTTRENSASIMVAIGKPYKHEMLETLSRESSIIPQCIEAYKTNAVGYGYDFTASNKRVDAESSAYKSEENKAQDIIDQLFLDMTLEDSFKIVIDNMERYGYGAFEVIRDMTGKPAELIPFEDVETLYLMPKDKEPTEYQVLKKGKAHTKRKRFRRFYQKSTSAYSAISTSGITTDKVYYKEYGDPRVVNLETGKVGNDTPRDKQANELIYLKALDFNIYGVPRWEGNMLTADGMRKAERLNQNYFNKGRHTPLMIVVQNGSLTEDAWGKLQEYMTGIEGEEGQHGFLVLETEQLTQDSPLMENEKSNIEIKDMAKVLQKDELFQVYLDNGRRKIQSSFMLPDIYVAYTEDYNVATARVAVIKTEEQVFQPYRRRLENIINNKVFEEHGIYDVKFKFNGPSVDNTDIMVEMFKESAAAGGITPQIARSEYARVSNITIEEYDQEWKDTPLQIMQMQISDVTQMSEKIDEVIEKANSDKRNELLPILKELKETIKKHKDVD